MDCRDRPVCLPAYFGASLAKERIVGRSETSRVRKVATLHCIQNDKESNTLIVLKYF